MILRPIPIPGVSSVYQVSSDGRLFRNDGKDFYQLSTCPNRNGYPSITLRTVKGTRKEYTVHRLVALAFIKNDDPSKDQVHHIDGNPFNNRAANLCWSTQTENTIEAMIAKYTKENDGQWPQVISSRIPAGSLMLSTSAKKTSTSPTRRTPWRIRAALVDIRWTFTRLRNTVFSWRSSSPKS